MSVGLVVESRGFERAHRYLMRLSQPRTEEILTMIGGLLETQTRERFNKTRTAPDGSTWAPLSPAYARWKEEHKPNATLLILEGYMRDSIGYNVNRDELEWGSRVDYAVYHQGVGHPSSSFIPPRQFLGISDKDEKEIDRAIDKWFRKYTEGGL